MLCEFCQGINVEQATKPGGYPHAPDIETVERNAQSCRLCQWIRRTDWFDSGYSQYAEYPVQSPKLGPLCYVIIQDYQKLGHRHSQAYLKFTSGDFESNYMAIYTAEGDPAAQDFGIPLKKQFFTSSSPEAFETCRSWISRCLSEHNCTDSSLLPSAGWERADLAPLPGPGRLVDLRGFSSSSPKLRIVNTREVEESVTKVVPYATLSYCWGKEPFHKTILANLQQADIDLSYDNLPSTFQHAFIIAKRLGVDFIWIDALCIIQDSEDDWNIESAKMPYIYCQAVFCIAADFSANASGGCFNDTSSSYGLAEDPIVIRSSLSGGQESTLYVYEAALARYAPKTVENAPVARRGWTYQERMLSPRILHYTSEQVFWECRKEYLAQDGTTTWIDPFEPSCTISGLTKYKDPLNSIEGWYRSIVAAFSARNLTYGKDKLPALSGIARVYHRALQCEYISGIWVYQLGYGLSWSCSTPETSPQQTRHNSFSWTSVQTPVKWPSEPLEPTADLASLFQLKNYYKQLINQHDPFGETAACALLITGLLKKAKLSRQNCGHGHFDWVVTGWTEFGVTELGTVYMDAVSEGQEKEQERDVWCLPVSKGYGTYYALVLAHVDEKSRYYSRLGLLGIDTEWNNVNGITRRVCPDCFPRWDPSDEGCTYVVDPMRAWFGDCTMQDLVLV